ncbi:RDD family protein [Kurthia gibsonii]|uniref:RDD family protein n=1 Tax=Kurthia gibsonii TaxID=33946 RepID=UPI002DB6141E|nr:RDD family protein [Kurthia gibsonii]MEB7772643.1 RDD family protein [Kurthia gibsonii]
MTQFATQIEMQESAIFEHKSAGFWVRFFAFLIDLLLVNTVLVGLLLQNIIPKSIWENELILYISISAVLSGVMFYIYFILMTKFLSQTLGKMIFGLKVVRDDGEPLSWSTVLFREGVGRFISMTVKILYLIIPFTPKHKAVHDFIADTHVIHERAYSKKEQVVSQTVEV